MEKRVFIAILLSFGVMYVYSLMFPQQPRKAEPVKGQGQISSVKSGPAAAVTASPATSVPVAPITAEAKDVTIDTDLYTAVLTTRGAALKKFVLKNYKESAGAQGKPILLIAGDPVQPPTFHSEAKGLGIAQDALYSVNGESGIVSGGGSRILEFTTTSGGVTLVKRYTFHSDKYAIDLDHQVINRSPARIQGSLQLLLVNPAEPKQGDASRYETYGAVTFSEDKLHADAVKDVAKEPKQYGKGILWTGFNDKYFLTSVLAVQDSIAEVKIRQNQAFIEHTVSSPGFALDAGQSISLSDKVYIGPKDIDILKAQGNRLEEVIDFGWFSALAKPLLQTIKFFYRYTGNYGIAIIIITIILKLLFFPLTHKSYKSMKEMQKLQPKMTELKEKHKNDRDALNRAIMELYQTHKVNPIGGCLPMIVQIPVFFALYKALMFSIELRHAPFMLWIQDLSAKDPYYVTPLIMGATMFIQQKMTPTTGMDPVQAKMMLALPVVFTFMFLNFPSGLVLYWLINNILTIAQQYYINKHVT